MPAQIEEDLRFHIAFKLFNFLSYVASGASVHRRYDKLLTHAWMKNMEIMPEVFFIVLPRNLMLYRCVTVIAVIYLLQTLRLHFFGKFMWS